MMNKAEEIILNSAWSLYDELAAQSENRGSLLNTFEPDHPKALVVLDGASIRELPLLKSLAQKTGFEVVDSSYGYAGLPSETNAFVEQRLVGKPISPSQLDSRKELKSKNISTYYYDTPIRSFELPKVSNSLLLWSAFPDGTYTDFEARSSAHFESLVKQFDVVWKNIILAIPSGHEIVITSDHGYIYFGVDMESSSRFGSDALAYLNQDRFRILTEGENLPSDNSDLMCLNNRRAVMLKGRIKNHPQGKSSNKIFRHGGMSLMEMLTPWLVIKKKKS